MIFQISVCDLHAGILKRMSFKFKMSDSFDFEEDVRFCCLTSIIELVHNPFQTSVLCKRTQFWVKTVVHLSCLDLPVYGADCLQFCLERAHLNVWVV